jgi:hypothetical protein
MKFLLHPPDKKQCGTDEADDPVQLVEAQIAMWKGYLLENRKKWEESNMLTGVVLNVKMKLNVTVRVCDDVSVDVGKKSEVTVKKVLEKQKSKSGDHTL